MHWKHLSFFSLVKDHCESDPLFFSLNHKTIIKNKNNNHCFTIRSTNSLLVFNGIQQNIQQRAFYLCCALIDDLILLPAPKA